jgi:hypothetical protein
MSDSRLRLAVVALGLLSQTAFAQSGSPTEASLPSTANATATPRYVLPRQDGDERIRFNGFADITFGTDFGDAASVFDRTNWETFGEGDSILSSYGKGFGIVGADFVVTADIAEDLVFLGEINLQTSRDGSDEIGLDTERFFLDYRHSELINVQAGLFFTPIGYHNRFLYSRAWLMHSVQVPDLFEEDLNLVPTHTVGINVHGTFDLFGQRMNYAVGTGNGRAADPVSNTFARDEGGKEYTALLEWIAPGADDCRVGLSGWYSPIDTYVVGALGNSVTISSATPLSFDETGFNPYVTYLGKHFNVLAESVYSDHGGQKALFGATIEISLNLHDNTIHPFVRYDTTDLPDGDQGNYFGLRRDGDTLTKIYVPEFDGVMFGADYDVNPNTRLKLEFAHHFDGPRDENSVVFQVAFGF